MIILRPLLLSLTAVSFAAVPAIAWAQVSVAADTIDTRIAATHKALQRFATSHLRSDLKSAFYALISAGMIRVVASDDLVTNRRKLVAAYATVLYEIDGQYDPTFDPDDPKNQVHFCVSPPQEPSGRRSPCGADPNDIPDPSTRAAYLAAIQAENAKIQRHNNYVDVNNLDQSVMGHLQYLLQAYRTEAPPDSNTLNQIVRGAGLSDARRAKINAMF
jgi:hypothetical protein